MTITVMVDGVPVYCESAADAVAVAREAATAGAAVSQTAANGHGRAKGDGTEKAVPPGSRWTEQRVREFFRLIKERQRKLVDTLLDATDGQTDAQLCQVLNLADGRALAGVFTGLFKNAKKVGADPKDLYQREAVTISDNRQFEYTLTEGFRTAARKWRP